ncbi:tyrosinase precursor [Sordaria brevicollis]|uniref:tyrosinase n=1 Tax=Sordaria brevicollis TaxID=83679 RepID=A0AAE0P8W8_SORBR|nr:tyrosinase precursor [Sordaria brevicollis]
MSTDIKFAITGVPTTPSSNGAVPLRRELRDLQTNYPDQFNLYLLGLRDFQGIDESKLDSYYQVAGIHGMPFKPWGGVPSDTDWSQPGSSGFGGYCTHSSILFITWHRPYLALFEQALYASVQAAAQKFPIEGGLRAKYVAAAKDFRAPYFDWASQPPKGTLAFPESLSARTIQVVDVDGKTKSINNPLNRFTFHPVNPSPGDFSAAWSRYPSTVRYPNRQTGASRDERIAPILANELASLRNNVSLLLLSYKDFDAFSYNRWDPSLNPGDFGSLEDVHNEIHDRTGGNGHMSSLEVSAFDPLFWLHHINVDRLWSIWQDLNPDSFMTPRPAPYSTFVAQEGEAQSQDTPLEPFWDRSTASFWTSEQVKDSTTFGYAYPETQKWKYSSEKEYQAAIRKAVTALYGSNVFANFVDNVAERTPGLKKPLAAATGDGEEEKSVLSAAAAKAVDLSGAKKVAAKAHDMLHHGEERVQKPVVNVEDAGAEPSKTEGMLTHSPEKITRFPTNQVTGPIPDNLKYLAPDGKYTDWIVNVRAQKHGLGRSFRVIVFLGEFNPDPETWDEEFNCVGRVSVLGRSAETQCGKCRKDNANGLIVSGTVPLTSALLQDIVGGELQSLKPEDVIPHLRANLRWKVALFNGDEYNLEEVPDLKVSVASTEVTIDEEGLPHYSRQYTVYPEITEGKPCGHGPEDRI